jgi:hypothetical protein
MTRITVKRNQKAPAKSLSENPLKEATEKLEKELEKIESMPLENEDTMKVEDSSFVLSFGGEDEDPFNLDGASCSKVPVFEKTQRTLADILRAGAVTPNIISDVVNDLMSIVISWQRKKVKILRVQQVRDMKLSLWNSILENIREHQACDDDIVCVVRREYEQYSDSDPSSDEDENEEEQDQDSENSNEKEDSEHEDSEHGNNDEQDHEDEDQDSRERSENYSEHDADSEQADGRTGPNEEEKQNIMGAQKGAEKDLDRYVGELEKWEREGREVSMTTLAKTFMTGVLRLMNAPKGEGSGNTVSKIDTWGTEKSRGKSLQDWLEHVDTILDARNITDEKQKVKMAATYLRGHAANRWKQCLAIMKEKREPITWRAFKNALQTQHDGVLPAQRAREYLMDFRVSKNEKPRSMTIRFRSLMDEVRLQEQHSRVNLPDGETLVNAYLNALKKWEHVHAYAVRLHAEKLGQWDAEAQTSTSSFARADTQEKWLQILQSIMDAVTLWDNGSNFLGNEVKEPEIVKRGRELIAKHRGVKRPLRENSERRQQHQQQPRKVRKIEDIFKLSAEVYKDRKEKKACFACGEKHMVFDCTSATSEQKRDYAAAMKHARSVSEAKRRDGNAKA